MKKLRLIGPQALVGIFFLLLIYGSALYYVADMRAEALKKKPISLSHADEHLTQSISNSTPQMYANSFKPR